MKVQVIMQLAPKYTPESDWNKINKKHRKNDGAIMSSDGIAGMFSSKIAEIEGFQSYL